MSREQYDVLRYEVLHALGKNNGPRMGSKFFRSSAKKTGMFIEKLKECRWEQPTINKRKQTPQGYDIINVIYNLFDINGTNFLAVTKNIHVYCSEQVIILITIYKLWHHNYLTWLRVFYILWLFLSEISKVRDNHRSFFFLFC